MTVKQIIEAAKDDNKTQFYCPICQGIIQGGYLQDGDEQLCPTCFDKKHKKARSRSRAASNKIVLTRGRSDKFSIYHQAKRSVNRIGLISCADLLLSNKRTDIMLRVSGADLFEAAELFTTIMEEVKEQAQRNIERMNKFV